MDKNLSNRLAMAVLWGSAIVTVSVLFAVILYVFINGVGQLSLEFIFTWPEGVNAEGGIWPTVVSTMYVTALAMLIVTPIAILAAVYLAEYAVQGRLVRTIRFAADSLASVPSIVTTSRPCRVISTPSMKLWVILSGRALALKKALTAVLSLSFSKVMLWAA